VLKYHLARTPECHEIAEMCDFITFDPLEGAGMAIVETTQQSPLDQHKFPRMQIELKPDRLQWYRNRFDAYWNRCLSIDAILEESR
jgi:hypothetical protein